MVLRVTKFHVYVQGLVNILQSDKDNVENVIKDVTDKWSQSAVDYFNVYLKYDIINQQTIC